MANFNKSVNKGRNKMNPTVNHEGNVVHKLDTLESLFSKVLGSFFGESTFYEKRDSEQEFKKLYELVQDVPDVDKEYVLKIAEIGRMCNMIAYPLNVLSCVYNTPKYLGNNFKDDKGRNKIFPYADKIILRTKDITSLMSTQFYMFDKRSKACIDGVEGKSLPMQFRKTLKKKLQYYDEFKLSKGLGKSNDVTLADCIKLLRPKPKTKELAQYYKNIIEDKVKVGNTKATINNELVQKGQKRSQKIKTDNKGLEKAVTEDNLMNILKNLVSLIKQGVLDDTATLNRILERFRDPKDIRLSKLLPFRFLTAGDEVHRQCGGPVATKVKEALEDAMDLAIDNVEKIEGNTAILIDISYSMDHSISNKASTKAKDIACVLGAIAYKVSDAELFSFSSEVALVNVSKRDSVMTIARAIKKAVHCSGTELNKALRFIDDRAKTHKIKYDGMLFLTDGDCYGYDKQTNTLSLKDGWSWDRRNSADDHVNKMISSGTIKRLWVNNLLGNDFSVCCTANDKKNLLAGFSEKSLNIISTYNNLGHDKDIRKVIDDFYSKLKYKGKK